MHSIKTKITAMTVCVIVIAMVIATVLGVTAIRNIGNHDAEQTLLLLCETGQKDLNYYFQNKYELLPDKYNTIVKLSVLKCYNNDNLYTFYLNNSFSYNNIKSTPNKIFYLSLLRPRVINANCSLPLNIEKEQKFDITCEINENIKSYVIQTRNENPKDIEYNTQYIIFKGSR